MTDVEAYVQTLRRLEEDQARADALSEKRKAAISAIRDLIAANGGTVSPTGVQGPGYVYPRIPSGLTMKDAAVWMLKTAGKPLRVRELYDHLKLAGFPYEGDYERFRGSMTPTLDRADKIFHKVGAGLYDLTEEAWSGKTDEPQTAEGGLGL